MFGLFAQTIFVATRISPIAQPPASRDWRSLPGVKARGDIAVVRPVAKPGR